MINYLIFCTTVLLFYYINTTTCLSPRSHSGCALISNKIFCYGGNPAIVNQTGLDIPHISLDLTQLHDITSLDDSKIQWSRVTDVLNSTQTSVIPRAYQSSALVVSDNSYIMFGEAVSNSFLNYNPQTYTWRSMQVNPNINATMSGTIVNMGDDMIWIWGGESLTNSTLPIPNIAHIYNYKTASWVNQIIENNVPVRIAHTATLGLDSAIYVLGGLTKIPGGNLSQSDFNEVMKFDTKSSQWSYFNATGHSASPRMSHTSTQLSNRNQLFIYGGLNVDQFRPATDYCIIFDYSNNTFQSIEFSVPLNSANSRVGHFAAVYNETYLMMTFGLIDSQWPAPSLSVLNISNPFSPQWVTSLSSVSNNVNNGTNSTSNNDSNTGLSSGVIAAIVVPVVIVVLIAVAIFVYIYKKRGKKYKSSKYSFDIDETDPRLQTKEIGFNSNDSIKYAKLTIDHDEKDMEGNNKANDDQPDDDFCKPFGNSINRKGREEKDFSKAYDDFPTDAFCKSLENATDEHNQDIEYIKPTENQV